MTVEGVSHAGEEAALLAELGDLFAARLRELAQQPLLLGFELGGRAHVEVHEEVAASLGVKHLRDGYELRTETNAGPLTRPLRGAGSQLMLLDSCSRLELSRAPLVEAFTRMLARPAVQRVVADEGLKA